MNLPNRPIHLFFPLLFFFLIAFWAVQLTFADGSFNLDGVIENEYGATRSLDGTGNDDSNGDSEICAVPDANRGNLMEFHAYNEPQQNEWYFSFVTDSSQPLDDTSGSFFGKGAGTTVNYLIGIDVGCNGGAAGDMNAGTPWRRFFSWQGATYNAGNPGVDYFLPMFPTGANSMQGQLYAMSASSKTLLVPNIPITSRTVDFRRHLELNLDGALSGMPADLLTNNQLCLAIISTENSDGSDFNGGKVIDELGESSAVTGCNLSYRLDGQGGNGPMPVKVATSPVCESGGRPILGLSGTRQCTSLPARTTILAVDSGLSCEMGNIGVDIDGDIESPYTLLTESGFAAPYQGGQSTASDFTGESSARQFWNGAAMQNYGGNADITNVHTQTDGFFLYLDVSGSGLTAFGGLGQMFGQPSDEANLFIALDLPGIDSNTNSGEKGGSPENYAPPDDTNDLDTSRHPGNRPINFRGWDPDYIIEMIWAGDDNSMGNAVLWDWDGATWQNVGSFTTVESAGSSPSGSVPFNTSFHSDSNPPTATNLYFGRQPTSYEFAIPWAALGGKPAINDFVRIALHTTSNGDGWDINDQAPGIGQGANGLGSHERVGDLANENDNESDAAATGNDQTPYVGRTHGQAGRAPGSDEAIADSDTIEAYFVFTLDPETYSCTPTHIALQQLQLSPNRSRLATLALITLLLLGLSWLIAFKSK